MGTVLHVPSCVRLVRVEQRPNRRPGRAGSSQRDTVRIDGSPRSTETPVHRRDTEIVDTAAYAKRAKAPRRPRALLASALATTLWCATVVVTPILVCVILGWWQAGATGSVANVAAAAGVAWLSGHGVPVDIGPMHLSIPPLALTALIAWRLAKAAAGTTRAIGGRDTAAVRAAAGLVTIFYTGLVAGAAALCTTGPFTVDLLPALLHAVPLIIAATAFGAAREAGVLPWDTASVWLRRGLRTGMITVGALLACGAAATGVAFAVRGPVVADTLRVYGSESWIVALLSLLYLPNLAVWAAAYITGPGFAVGAGTAVQAELVELGPLPAFPVFAAVPNATLPAYATILIGLPLMLAAVFGVILTYRSPDLRVPRVTTAATVAAATAALALGLLAYLSGGAAGTDLLADLGPDPLAVAGIGGVQFLIGLVGAALIARLFAVHRRAAEAELVRRDTVVIPEPAPSRDDGLP
ncbi:hypothetical protein SAMN05216270_104304 [Glycomyces harbinensis]|uniref:Uncharacterized protein n=1 Tax=Glycomyces harbinensis TaxID=58114 RepID=A0A1G6VA93_9ACTN|nr:hypothetical protein SAMN05216270_104304 [Glycomyces harbinensis]